MKFYIVFVVLVLVADFAFSEESTSESVASDETREGNDNSTQEISSESKSESEEKSSDDTSTEKTSKTDDKVVKRSPDKSYEEDSDESSIELDKFGPIEDIVTIEPESDERVESEESESSDADDDYLSAEMISRSLPKSDESDEKKTSVEETSARVFRYDTPEPVISRRMMGPVPVEKPVNEPVVTKNNKVFDNRRRSDDRSDTQPVRRVFNLHPVARQGPAEFTPQNYQVSQPDDISGPFNYFNSLEKAKNAYPYIRHSQSLPPAYQKPYPTPTYQRDDISKYYQYQYPKNYIPYDAPYNYIPYNVFNYRDRPYYFDKNYNYQNYQGFFPPYNNYPVNNANNKKK